jgi:hypothetical protein
VSLKPLKCVEAIKTIEAALPLLWRHYPIEAIEMERDEEMEEAVNVEAANVSWTDCLRSFDTIRCFLRDNKLKTIGFEQVVESIRAEKQDRATSQLSIRSFFSRK